MAEHELRLPKIGMAMTEATVDEWLVEDGAAVASGQEVVTIATDKVDMSVEAPADGTLRILVQAGETVDVGALLAIVSDS